MKKIGQFTPDEPKYQKLAPLFRVSLDRDGAEIWPGLLPDAELKALSASIGSKSLPPTRGGVRGADTLFPAVGGLANDPRLLERIKPHTGGMPRLVRAILFHKAEGHNWLVAWHQDKTIAVSARHNHAGWKNWSLKDGLHHAQPPLDILDAMLTVRIHLDDTDEHNGCLKIIPGSHRLGILPQRDVTDYAACHESLCCHAKAGDALVMRPLLLHASGKAVTANPRRILHLEYSK